MYGPLSGMMTWQTPSPEVELGCTEFPSSSHLPPLPPPDFVPFITCAQHTVL